LPATAFVLAAPPTAPGGTPSQGVAAGSGAVQPNLSGSGTADYIPLWTNSSTLGNSVLYQSGTGSKAKVGINTTSPASTLDVKGSSTVRGLFALPAAGTATATAGYDSQPIKLTASAFNSGTGTAIAQNFQWQAEPVGNDTGSPSGTLNLLFAQGTSKLAETGLNIASNGQITFASGQTFPGTGTITGVTAGSGLTGGGSSGNVTLSVPNGGITNAMLHNSSLTVSANSPLSGGGAVSLGGSTSLGLKSCGSNQILEYSSGAWTCVNIPVGTVTEVDTGAGLTGGPITGKGTLSVPNSGITNPMLQNSSLTVTAGTDLTGGGAVSLGGSTTLNLDTSKVPTLAGSNTFSGSQTINNNVTVTATGTTLTASGGLTGLSGTGSSYGAYGSSSTGTGVYGTGYDDGVVGTSDSGYGVYGGSLDSTGVYGYTGSTWYGVEGYNSSTSGGTGVYGASSSGFGVYGYAPSGDGVVGYASSGDGVYGTSTSGYGVYGTSNSNVGVYGNSGTSNGVYATSGGTTAGSAAVIAQVSASSTNQLFGLIGNNTGSDYGAGVYGQDATSGKRSGMGSSWTDVGAGVWGDGGTSNNYGVIATADDSAAAVAENHSTFETLVVYNLNSNGDLIHAVNGAGNGCDVDSAGNINCTGSKNAVVPIDGGQRKVALSAIESPKNWFEDFGSAQLSNGSAVVAIEPEYRQTVNTEMDYKVFPVPKGDCKGLYVTNETPSSFEVRELGKGTSNVRFDYRIVALRKNFENIRMADHTNDFNPRKMMGKTGTPFRFETSQMKPPERPAPKLEPPRLPQPLVAPKPPQVKLPVAQQHVAVPEPPR
jgi:hypothetical protein